MREYAVEKRLRKKLAKLHKKDGRRYEAFMKKLRELLTCSNPDHYKNPRKPLQHLKAVHIDSHFVLTFRYSRKEDLIELYDLDHHGKVYKTK